MLEHSLSNSNVHFIGGNIPFIAKQHNDHFQTFHTCIYAKPMLFNNALDFMGFVLLFLSPLPTACHCPFKIKCLYDI